MTTALETPRPATAPVPVSGERATPPAAGYREPGALGLAVVLVGAYLAIVDFFIVNVALPSMGRELHATSAELELVVAGYATAYALTLVVGGRLGDAHGRRRLFGRGLLAFAVTSLLCGLAPSAATLVAARIAQGFAAAFMVPQVLATIQATTTGQRRARALGLFGATAGLAAGTGQVFGGLLVSANIAGSGWRPIFLVNVPVAIVAGALLRRVVPETFAPRAARIDATGTVLLGATVLAVMVPLTLGRSLGWPVWIWVVLGLAPVAAAAFVAEELRSERRGHVPLVPPSLLRHASMRRGLAISIPFFTGFGGFLFVYAVAMQTFLDWSPVRAGLAIAPLAVAFLIASLLTTRLLARFGRRVMTVGGGLLFTGLVVMAAVAGSSWPEVSALQLIPAMLLVGFGQGLIASPMFGVILSEVPVASAGVASGVLSTTQQISLALGTGLMGTLYASVSSPGSLGAGDGFAALVAVDALLAVVITVLTTRLPDPRAASAT